MKKLVNLKTLQYTKIYREFYKNPKHKNLQHVWFNGDTVKRNKIS